VTVPIVLSLVLLAVAGVVLYRRFGWPAVVAMLSGAAGLVAALWPRRGSMPTPPPPKAPDARVARTAGQIIEERETKAREVIAAAESPEDVADIMGRQK
jgi:hypothetical protein